MKTRSVLFAALAAGLIWILYGGEADAQQPQPYPDLPTVCKEAVFDWEAIAAAAIEGPIPHALVAEAEKDTEACLDQLLAEGALADVRSSCESKCGQCGDEAPSCVVGCIVTGKVHCDQSGEALIESCEVACTKCEPWDVPKCLANCVSTGQPSCDTTPNPDSCSGECGHHCPPWKDPEKYSNCLVSCADTGRWACYDDGGQPCE